MSQFNYLNEINSVLVMDGDITKGPAPRWQKKLNCSGATLNGSINTSKISVSFNSAMSTALTTSNKTPQKSGTSIFKGKKTPGKSPGSYFLFLHTIETYSLVNIVNFGFCKKCR